MQPDADLDSPAFVADLAACRAALCGGSRTFFAASRVLPARIAGPATALYAFCREADDVIDCGTGTLAGLQARLDAIYAGRPQDRAADRALAAVAAHFTLPRALLDALLDGFAWDNDARRYETLEELEAYAARVAGTVGACMAVLMRARSPASLARACDLGTAMQLTNIARDVGEDARAGRLYLPLAWLAAEGIDPDAFLANPSFTPALGRVVRRLLGAAAALYRRAQSGIASLPWDCRPGIAAASLMYEAIGREVARNGYDSVTRRAVVPRGRKLAVLSRAALAIALPGTAVSIPPLAACAALVHAAQVRPAAPATLDDRIAWLFDLFARLEQSGGASGPARLR